MAIGGFLGFEMLSLLAFLSFRHFRIITCQCLFGIDGVRIVQLL